MFARFSRNAQLTHASGTSFQPASVPVWCLCSSFPNGTDGRRNNPTRHPAPHRWSTTVAVPLASVLDGVFAAVFVERKVTTRFVAQQLWMLGMRAIGAPHSETIQHNFHAEEAESLTSANVICVCVCVYVSGCFAQFAKPFCFVFRIITYSMQ